MTKKLEGIIASQGLAMGPAKRFIKEELTIDHETISEDRVKNEQSRVDRAFSAYADQLKSRGTESQTQQEVLEAHLELLSDPYYADTVKEKIQNNLCNAETALEATTDEMASMMESLEDAYLKERGADYRDIGENLLYLLLGKKPQDLSQLAEDCIIVCQELTPSDTSLMDKKRVLGFANDLGGKTSHTSIIAQTLGIPALVGMKTVSQEITDGDFLILDAQKGFVLVNPDEEVKKSYADLLQSEQEERARLESVKNREAVTKDGRKISVATNIGNLQDLTVGFEAGADGCGLFRTEFLYMDNSHFPTEEEQFAVYREAASQCGDRPLLIRTLDIGGDKSLSYYSFPKEDNPFLGWRALRICFDKPEIFRAQLRAILRASAFGNVKILLPMVISVEEIIKVRELVETYKKELQAESIDYNDTIDVGMMVETPASVMMAPRLAKYCDYFSIGTNDLTQYILAVDRGNDVIANLYNTYNPAVLAAIKRVIDSAHEEGKWCGMCGGFAGDTDATYLLLGLGLDEFSAPASKVAEVKDIILASSYDEAKKFAEEVLQLESMEEIDRKIKENHHR